MFGVAATATFGFVSRARVVRARAVVGARETAAELGVSVDTVRRAVADGKALRAAVFPADLRSALICICGWAPLRA